MEHPLIQKQWKKGINSLDIVYPNKKFGGAYNLGILIIYNLVNNIPNWICNRVFLDEGKISSSLIGFTFQYEPDYYNLPKMLSKAGIALEKEKRRQVVFAGGPCVNANPSALSRYMDFLVMGDAEEIVPKILNAYTRDKPKFLEAISKIPGVFVPGLNNPSCSYVKNLDDTPYPLYQPLPVDLPKEYVFGNAFLLEVERGCPFFCKFCPMPLRGGVRIRSLEKIKKIIDDGIALNKRKKVILYTASFTHPERKEILKYLLSKNIEFSVPSIKVELADSEFLELIKKGGQRTLTIAPECNEELRFKIGKHVKDEQYFKFIEKANELSFDTIKMYFMIGIPGMDEKSLKEMAGFIAKAKKMCKVGLYISVNPFVPKPGTALSSHKFDEKIVKKQAKFLQNLLGKANIRFKVQGTRQAKEEWVLAHTTELVLK
ncbi:MAG: B12-binding domain-containing radical SAM protein [Nanoarchaeota archaeon]|nr:B12-binding domain-containing radical SAM protein [Nanoarchaeota archaeon]